MAASGTVADARHTGTREFREPFALPFAPVKLLARHEVMGYLPIRFAPDGRLCTGRHRTSCEVHGYSSAPTRGCVGTATSSNAVRQNQGVSARATK